MEKDVVLRLKMASYGGDSLSLTPISPNKKTIDTYNRWWFPEPHPKFLPGIGLHPETPFVIRNGKMVRVTVEEWIEDEQKALDSCCWTAIKPETNEVLGNISARRINFPVCEIVYLIGPEYQGQGMGTLMVSAALALLSEYGFKHIKADVDLRNPGSARVLVKNRFSLLSEDDEQGNYQIDLWALPMLLCVR